MAKKAFEWVLAALLLNTLQVGFGLYEIYVLQTGPTYEIVFFFMPGVVLNVIMFVYLLRKKTDIVADV